MNEGETFTKITGKLNHEFSRKKKTPFILTDVKIDIFQKLQLAIISGSDIFKIT